MKICPTLRSKVFHFSVLFLLSNIYQITHFSVSANEPTKLIISVQQLKEAEAKINQDLDSPFKTAVSSVLLLEQWNAWVDSNSEIPLIKSIQLDRFLQQLIINGSYERLLPVINNLRVPPIIYIESERDGHRGHQALLNIKQKLNHIRHMAETKRLKELMSDLSDVSNLASFFEMLTPTEIAVIAKERQQMFYQLNDDFWRVDFDWVELNHNINQSNDLQLIKNTLSIQTKQVDFILNQIEYFSYRDLKLAFESLDLEAKLKVAEKALSHRHLREFAIQHLVQLSTEEAHQLVVNTLNNSGTRFSTLYHIEKSHNDALKRVLDNLAKADIALRTQISHVKSFTQSGRLN